MGQQKVRFVAVPGKASWIVTKIVCSAYYAPTLFGNLQMRTSTYRERGALQTCYQNND